MYEEEFEYDGPSKSQLKREAEAKQDFGESLMALSESDLDLLDLPGTLVEAVLLAKTIRHGGGLKRQKQLIGKLMRQLDDEDYELVVRRLDAMQAGSERQKGIEKWVENKVERLLNNDPAVHDEIVEQLGEIDFQHMRQLVRNSLSEIKKGGKSRSRTLLFRYLRDKFAQNP
ncbi:ribosome biogenesis factor YjgA [Wohlfahrtiimonas chitiniclastica]|uniref:ribosome biogenesis factor YjgA n=1 Tax=Wohlfahrtiimonas chitiniclastica TaxID=400946 RepID=UPI00037A0739|nr:ribosome biogenesis factor YjgA [Wohlfahrtiimonas chitiniclastica]